MNEYDLLLHWLSARPQGEASMSAVTDACLTLAQHTDQWRPDTYKSLWRARFLGTLHRMGHVEPAGRHRWAIIPPIVLWMSGKNEIGEAHLYGARSLTLWNTMQQIFGGQFSRIPQHNGPELWQFTGTRLEAAEFARTIGNEVCQERGDVLLASLPTLVEAMQRLRGGSLSVSREGWQFFRVRPSQHRGFAWQWIDVQANQLLHPGVYKAVEGWPPTWLYVSHRPDSSELRACVLDERNPEHRFVACWCELARLGRLSLRYDAATRILAIPDVRVPLPVLVDRALRLASGTSPDTVTYDRCPYLAYKNIGLPRARQVGRVLGLRVETPYG